MVLTDKSNKHENKILFTVKCSKDGDHGDLLERVPRFKMHGRF
jgi:hypothetical protein